MEIIDVLKTGSTILSPAMQSVVTAMMTTLFIRRNTVSSELEKIKACKFHELIDELLENGKMSYVEFFKCKNFLKVAELADKATNNSSEYDSKDGQFSFDWFMRFFDAVGNISNSDLQTLWSKILTNEINRPQSFSLRTLSMVSDMTPIEARTFTSLCKYVLQSGESYFILPYGFYDESEGYSDCRNFMKGLDLNSCMMTMLEIGVLTSTHDLAVPLSSIQNLEMHNENIIAIIESKLGKDHLFLQDAYLLTTSGVELFNVIKNMSEYETDIEYAILCFKEIKKHKEDINISAYKILKNEDELSLDSTDLLSD